MNAAERSFYLEAAHAVLVPLGFRQKKKEFEWRRVAERDIEWIHLNFGLGVINPSYGVRYSDVDALFPPELTVRCGPWCMLQDLTGTSYSVATTPPSVVSRDLLRAVEEFHHLRDRQAFTDLLMRDDRSNGAVILFSYRIRMLPAMLGSLGRLDEAFSWLAQFEAVAPDRDQMLPSYGVYAAYFRSKFQEKKS
jgi:hypothetical protein